MGSLVYSAVQHQANAVQNHFDAIAHYTAYNVTLTVYGHLCAMPDSSI